MESNGGSAIKHITTKIVVEDGVHYTLTYSDGLIVNKVPTAKSQIRPVSTCMLWKPTPAMYGEVFKNLPIPQTL